jgi:hypothetical protein
MKQCHVTKCTPTNNISTVCNRLHLYMWVLTVCSDILCKQLYFKILTVVVLSIFCLMIQLCVRSGFLSYDLVMAPLKMENKCRNMLGQPNWRCNVLNSFVHLLKCEIKNAVLNIVKKTSHIYVEIIPTWFGNQRNHQENFHQIIDKNCGRHAYSIVQDV